MTQSVFGLTVESSAQQTTTLSQRASNIRRKVEQLTPGAHVSVVPVHAPEEFGNFVSSDDRVFTFYDVDQKANVVLHYEDVKKIKNGYGGYNSIRWKHTDPSKRLIGALVALGVIGALIGAAVTAQ